jgi:hypothetical protein
MPGALHAASTMRLAIAALKCATHACAIELFECRVAHKRNRAFVKLHDMLHQSCSKHLGGRADTTLLHI